MPRKPKTPTTSKPAKPKVVPLFAQSETSKPGPEGRKTRQRGAPLHQGLTDKQEAYCQAVIGGSNLSDAYRSAYDCTNMADKTIHEAASRLFVDSKVSARIKVLSGQLDEKRRMLAASDADFALETLRRMAAKADTDSARIRAAELLAKASGVFVDQVEMTDKTDRSEADIEQAIKARLARLGIAV